MGAKSDEFKEVNWGTKSLKSQLYSFNDRLYRTDDGKGPDSSDAEGNR